MSSARPNLQNIPRRDLRVRYVIKARPGRVLVGCDLDSVELWVLSAYAPGGALEKAFAVQVTSGRRKGLRIQVETVASGLIDQ